MSTQPLLIPQGVTVQQNGRRIAIITSIAVALFAGALIGRATAPDTSSLVAHPATLLTVGHLSQGDAGRAEMFRAMNGLLPTATIQPATTARPEGRVVRELGPPRRDVPRDERAASPTDLRVRIVNVRSGRRDHDPPGGLSAARSLRPPSGATPS